MKVVVIIALLIAVIFADDKSFCMKKCAEKYNEGEIRNACNTGCDARPDISGGPFVFVQCYQSCDNKFNKENGTDYEIEAHAACSYACSLPMSRSLFMSVKYANDEKPVVEIIRREGEEVVDRAPHLGSANVDQFISRILGDMIGTPIIHNPVSTQHSQSEQDRNSSVKDSNKAMIESVHSRMIAMQNRMSEMLAAVSKQFFDGIRRQMQRQHNLLAERPTGHDYFARIGPEVDNFLANGEPIIITHSLNRDEDNGGVGRPMKVIRYQSSSNHPPSIFYWIMIVFGIGALLLTLYASVIFFRVMRSAAYKRISADVATSRRSTSLTSPGSLPVKKVPLDGWVDHSEPSGVPPPAYDQVSIHSLQKQQQHDGQFKEAQAKVDDTTPSSPVNGQK